MITIHRNVELEAEEEMKEMELKGNNKNDKSDEDPQEFWNIERV